MGALSADDAARKKFLATLVNALDDRWVAGYAEIKPYRVLGLTLRCEGIEGFVQVVPSVVARGGVHWMSFPGDGTPHFDLKPDGTGHVRTCVLDVAVKALETWAKSKQPIVRSAPTPMLPRMRARLEAIAAAPPAVVEDALDEAPWALTAAGRKQLKAARAVIDPGVLARSFPRDDDGRLVLDTRVLLALVDSTVKRAQGRDVFLVARGPRVRRDGDRIELVLADAIEANETHRWLATPWMWQAEKAPAAHAQAQACVTLLDAGKFDEALALYGVTLAPRVIKLLEAVPLGSHEQHPEAWQQATRRALWELAPWKLTAAPRGSFALIPHQRHQVKSWLAWHPPSTIELDGTASNARLARVAWARTDAEDIARLGIEVPAQRAKAPRIAKATPAPVQPTKPLAELIAGKELWKAKTALAHAKRRPAADALAELLAIVRGSAPAAERANALWIASEVAPAGQGAVFAEHLTDRDLDVRRIAIQAVKSAGYVEAVPVLAQMVIASRAKREDVALGVHAATAMKTLSGTRGPAGLVGYFSHADPRVREAACIAVTFYSDGRKLALPHLERLLLDDDAAVAAAAKAALHKIG